MSYVVYILPQVFKFNPFKIIPDMYRDEIQKLPNAYEFLNMIIILQLVTEKSKRRPKELKQI